MNNNSNNNTSQIAVTQNRAFDRFDQLQAEFALTDGLIEITVLFDLKGNWVPAKWINTQYGTSWLVLDEAGASTGVFVPYASKKRETQAKRGFVEGIARVPAEVILHGGFRPTASIVPAQPNGTVKPKVIITTDRFTQEAGK